MTSSSSLRGRSTLRSLECEYAFHGLVARATARIKAKLYSREDGKPGTLPEPGVFALSHNQFPLWTCISRHVPFSGTDRADEEQALNLISRVDGGWNVRMSLAGKRLARFFADSRFGGKTAALKAARAHRDELLAKRAARPKPKPRPVLVIRGTTPWFQIRLPKPGGGTTTTEFSVNRHGPRKARRLAVDALEAAERRAGKS